MMFQFHNRIADSHRLIFLLFNQLQRHAVTRIIPSKFKTDHVSLNSLGNLINSPNFIEHLREAAINPKTKSARLLLKFEN